MGGAARTVNNGAWKRRSVMALTIAGCFASAWAQTPAAPYPSKTVTIVVPFSAGGGVDTVARMLADKLRTSLGQPVVVDNKAGAGGNLAASDVAKGPADGTLILTGIDSTFTVNPQVYDKLVAACGRYLMVAEYYNPAPVAIPYRGHSDRLFKRDFAGEIMDRHPQLQLVDYGFAYRRDPNFPQDDITWFLMEKR